MQSVVRAPEGGAHQAVATPLIGIGQPGLAAFEPAFSDELATLLSWAFDYLQRDGAVPVANDFAEASKGGSV